MFAQIRRYQRSLAEVLLDISVEATAAVDVRDVAGGSIEVPADSSITVLTYYAAVAPDGDLLPLFDASGAALTQAVTAGGIYPLSDACFGVAMLALVADSAGVVSLSLKG